MSTKSVVILSGGMDSAYALMRAMRETKVEECIFFKYGQRNAAVEEATFSFLCRRLQVPSTFVYLPLASVVKSQLTGGERATTEQAEWFVPGRNAIFLTVAASRAYSLGAEAVYSGICSTSPTAYSDCTLSFMESQEKTLRLALDYPSLALITPGLHLERWELFKEAGLLGSKEMDLMRWHTNTGYGLSRSANWLTASQVDRAKQWDWGYGPENPDAFDIALKSRREAWFKFIQWYEDITAEGGGLSPFDFPFEYGHNPS